MAVIGQSHLLRRSWVPDHISHSNTIVRIVPIEVGRGLETLNWLACCSILNIVPLVDLQILPLGEPRT